MRDAARGFTDVFLGAAARSTGLRTSVLYQDHRRGRQNIKVIVNTRNFDTSGRRIRAAAVGDAVIGWRPTCRFRRSDSSVSRKVARRLQVVLGSRARARNRRDVRDPPLGYSVIDRLRSDRRYATARFGCTTRRSSRSSPARIRIRIQGIVAELGFARDRSIHAAAANGRITKNNAYLLYESASRMSTILDSASAGDSRLL